MAALSNNIRAYLQFEESLGSFTDTGPNTYTVTNFNSVSTSGSGKINNAASFSGGTSNGSAPYLSLPASVVTGMDTFTFSVWAYPSVTTAWQRLFNLSGGTGYMYVTISNASSRIETQINDGTTGAVVTHSSNTVINTWYHIVVVCARGALTLYVNGALSGTVAATKTPAQAVLSPTALWLGRSGTSSDAAFQGLMDEWSLFNRPLTSLEITYLYNSGTGRNKATVSALDVFTAGAIKGPGVLFLTGTSADRKVIAGMPYTVSDVRPSSGIILPRNAVKRNV